MKIISSILSVMVLSSLVLIGVTAQTNQYDPWYDFDDDGDIDIYDIVDIASRYGTTGTPINKTALLLELAARIDVLNSTVMSILENQTGVLNMVSDSFSGTTDAGDGTLVVNFPASSFVQTPEILYSRIVLTEAAGIMTIGTVAYGNILSITKDNFEIEVVEHKGSFTTVNGKNVDVVYLAIETEHSELQRDCVTIAPHAFTPSLSGQVFELFRPNWLMGDGVFYASAQLPNGVQIQNLTARVYDSMDGGEVYIRIRRFNLTNLVTFDIEDLAYATSGYTEQPGDTIIFDDTIDHPQVDNENYVYSLEVYFTHYTGDLRLIWVHLEYEL